MLSNLHAVISKGYLTIEEKQDYSLDKEQTSYDDLLHALRESRTYKKKLIK